MNRQRTAALLIAAVSLSGVAATPALAAGSGKAKPRTAHAAKAVRPVPFTAVGTIAAVDVSARTVTVTVVQRRRAGSHVVAVPANAKIVRGAARVTLDKLLVGDKVVAVGRKVGSLLTASHVNAVAPRPVATPSSSSSASAAPTTVAEPQPVASASEPTS